MADNAGALTGKDMKKYIAGTNGAAGIMHIPPRTPQPSPIEVEWRETRAAMADTFFGGLDRMRDATMRMLRNREIPIVRLFEWLLPTWSAHLVCPTMGPAAFSGLPAPPRHTLHHTTQHSDTSPLRDASGLARQWLVRQDDLVAL